MGRRYEQTFLQRRHPNGQQTHEKVLNITQHQGNTYQNHSEMPPNNQSEWLKLTSQERTDAGEDAEKGEPSYTVGGNPILCGHSGKQHGGSSES